MHRSVTELAFLIASGHLMTQIANHGLPDGSNGHDMHRPTSLGRPRLDPHALGPPAGPHVRSVVPDSKAQEGEGDADSLDSGDSDGSGLPDGLADGPAEGDSLGAADGDGVGAGVALGAAEAEALADAAALGLAEAGGAMVGP